MILQLGQSVHTLGSNAQPVSEAAENVKNKSAFRQQLINTSPVLTTAICESHRARSTAYHSCGLECFLCEVSVLHHVTRESYLLAVSVAVPSRGHLRGGSP
jgi:hypothetical protein